MIFFHFCLTYFTHYTPIQNVLGVKKIKTRIHIKKESLAQHLAHNKASITISLLSLSLFIADKQNWRTGLIVADTSVPSGFSVWPLWLTLSPLSVCWHIFLTPAFPFSGSHSCICSIESHSILSDSLWPHGLYSPRNPPGQNTGVGCCSLLQGIFPTQGSNPGLPHCRWIIYQLSHQRSPWCSKQLF